MNPKTPPTNHADAMLRVGLMGRGKLGTAILEESRENGSPCRIVWAFGRTEAADRLPEAFEEVDVVIECTRPEAAKSNVLAALEAGIPVVCGSTGWLEDLPEVEQRCRVLNGSFLYAANFSIGVNLFFALNRWLAKTMRAWPEYLPQIEETHHTAKRDAPSGTAVHLAQDLIRMHPAWSTWHLEVPEASASVQDPSAADRGIPDRGSLRVKAFREADVPGTHRVRYQSAVDRLDIEHSASSRRGFAQGALAAAAWIRDKKGVFRMEDVLGLNT